MLPINGLKSWWRVKLMGVESSRWPWATTALKRLALAVQLRPAAPVVQTLATGPDAVSVPFGSKTQFNRKLRNGWIFPPSRSARTIPGVVFFQERTLLIAVYKRFHLRAAAVVLT
jgi:hypothetical protein